MGHNEVNTYFLLTKKKLKHSEEHFENILGTDQQKTNILHFAWLQFKIKCL